MQRHHKCSISLLSNRTRLFFGNCRPRKTPLFFILRPRGYINLCETQLAKRSANSLAGKIIAPFSFVHAEIYLKARWINPIILRHAIVSRRKGQHVLLKSIVADGSGSLRVSPWSTRCNGWAVREECICPYGTVSYTIGKTEKQHNFLTHIYSQSDHHLDSIFDKPRVSNPTSSLSPLLPYPPLQHYLMLLQF